MIPDFAGFVAQLPDPLALAVAFLAFGIVVSRLAFNTQSVGRYIFQFACFAGFTTMLVVARVFPFKPTPAMDLTLYYFAISGLKIIWWLVGAWLFSSLFRAILVFYRQPRETRLLRDLISGFIYISAFLAIIADVFDLPVSGLLAASGVIAIVLGLALQSTLGDVFSGIVLNLARPYNHGDWVIIDGSLQGRVIETNWRATQILTPDNNLAIFPNSLIAKAKLVNVSKPSKTHGVNIVIRLVPSLSPLRCCAVLETAMLSSNRILRSPAPTATVRTLDSVALECEVQFFVAAFEQGPGAQSEIFDLIFRHCAANNIRLAPPSGTMISMSQPEAPRDPSDVPRRLLKQQQILAPLTDEDRVQLAAKMKRRTFKAGDTVVKKGSIAQALFILSSGVLVALRSLGDGSGAADEEAMRLAPGDCFGLSGLLTGSEARYDIKSLTKSVVYELSKDDLDPTLTERPTIAADIALILSQREAVEKSRLQGLSQPDKPSENLTARLAERIKNIFGLA